MGNEILTFCKKCKYFGRIRHYARCEYPKNLEIKHDWEEQWESMIHNPSKINRNNDCKWFEPILE